MKMQTDCSVLEIIVIMIECFDFQMIVILFTFSEFLDFKKKDVKKELAFSEKIMNFFLSAVFIFLMKNLFLIDLLMFYFLIFFVTSVIQFSASLKALFSDFLKSAFSI